MEGNASVYQVNPVSRISGEGSAEFLRTWGPDFDQKGGGRGGNKMGAGGGGGGKRGGQGVGGWGRCTFRRTEKTKARKRCASYEYFQV